jgi:hypothetical protein
MWGSRTRKKHDFLKHLQEWCLLSWWWVPWTRKARTACPCQPHTAWDQVEQWCMLHWGPSAPDSSCLWPCWAGLEVLPCLRMLCGSGWSAVWGHQSVANKCYVLCCFPTNASIIVVISKYFASTVLIITAHSSSTHWGILCSYDLKFILVM